MIVLVSDGPRNAITRGEKEEKIEGQRVTVERNDTRILYFNAEIIFCR